MSRKLASLSEWWIDQYQKGDVTAGTIAETLGVSRYRVRSLLVEAGVTVRHAGAKKKNLDSKWIEAWQEGMTMKKIARMTGLSEATVAIRLKEAGFSKLARPHRRFTNPEQYQAYNRVRVAKRRGDLKYKPCVICKERATQHHHPDYADPLAVVDLCRVHHQFLHNVLRLIKEHGETEVGRMFTFVKKIHRKHLVNVVSASKGQA